MEFLLIKLLSTIPLRSYLFYVPAKLPPEVEVLGWSCNAQCTLYIYVYCTVQYSTVQYSTVQHSTANIQNMLIQWRCAMWWLIGGYVMAHWQGWEFDLSISIFRSFRRSAVIELIFWSQKTIDFIEKKTYFSYDFDSVSHFLCQKIESLPPIFDLFKMELIFQSFDHKKTIDSIEKPMIDSKPAY